MFEDVRRERSLLLLLSLKYPDILKQTKLTEHVKKLLWNFAPKKLHRQMILKQYVGASIRE